MTRPSPPPLSVHVTTHDGAPLSGVPVTRTAPDRTAVTATTDERGFARFEAAAGDPATVTVVAPGLVPDTRATGGDYPVRPDGVEEFVLAPAGLPAYYRGRVRVPFTPVTDAVGVRLTAPVTTVAATRDLDELGGPATRTIRYADPHAVVVRLDAPTDAGGVRELNAQASGLTSIGEVGAIVAMDDDSASFLTDTIVVSFLSGDVDPAEVADRHGLEIVKRFGALGHTYVMRSPAGAGYDLLDRVSAVAAEPGVRYAEPSLVHTAQEDAVVPNDFLFPQQWDHPIIRTPDAWQVLRDLDAIHTFGSPDVTVAVVDNGIDVTHPALAGTLTDGTAKVSQVFDFVGMVANNSSTTDGDHGMACATSAAGRADDGEGTAGIAGNCHVIGVRRGGDEVRYSEMYLWLAGLDAHSATAGFPAQLARGADVISNSIGFSVNSPISGLMADTFDAVTDDGRGGRGTALFFSTGNGFRDNDTTFMRPWSMYGRCYGVAASRLDTDGVTEIHAAYSNWSSTVDFCAPSHAMYRTTDPQIVHDPPAEYGALAATRLDAPEGEAIPGTAASTTTLSTASAAGATSVTVASVAGATVGGSMLVGAVGSRAARGRTISAVNAATRAVSFALPLSAAFANGTAVTFAPRQYKTDHGGTSYATPVMAGVAALMLSANPQLSWDQVGQIIKDTAVKIDPNQTDADGRWRDVDGRISTDPGYRGAFFSEWFGAGRVDAAAAVARAAWTVDPRTTALEFRDVPEGEEVWRAVRFDVHSLHASTFTVTAGPGAPFGLPLGATESLTGTADYAVVQEAYLWVRYVGTTAGATAAGSVTVRHDQTGRTWTLPISADTVARQTACVMLVLDRSGSMASPSGVGSTRRIDVLRYSGGILADVVHEGDGVGIVGFDDDPFTVLVPPAGPMGPPGSAFDVERGTVRTAIAGYAVNPLGGTSIGDGLELGQSELTPVSTYDRKATIVFTDGYENSQKWLGDVSGSITDRTYAVALGRADQIKPAGLNAVTKGTGGYCVLTDDLDNNSRFKLAKYFLQVLAGVKNDQVVVDPPVTVPPGATVDVPFVLAETDYAADVLLMTAYPWLIEMSLVTPDGDVVDPAFLAGLAGRNDVHVGQDVVYYRLTLPAPIGAGAREGTWLARFHLDERRLTDGATRERLTRTELRALSTKGLDGTLLVHASSSLRMDVELRQDALEPGAEIAMTARLTEYDVPVAGRARVLAEITGPGGGVATLALSEVAPGVFEEVFEADREGVWSVLFRAAGTTFRGSPFTREGVRTAAVWRGGDSYRPEEGAEPTGRKERLPHRWCEIIREDPQLLELLSSRLRDGGVDGADIAELVGPRPGELEQV